MQAAIDSKSIEMVQWVFEEAPYSWIRSRALSSAAVNCDKAMLEYLRTTYAYLEWQDEVCGDTPEFGVPTMSNMMHTLKFVLDDQ